jgi:formate dehydrogenase subunit gamma
MPAAAQQPTSVNPTAASVNEQQLLQQLNAIEGRGSIPDVKSYVIEHPAGREWREYRTVTLKWIGGIAMLGILAVLTAYYLWHGTMRIEAGRSGRKLLRFSVFERFVHWLTAVTFVILGITGLNITFGRSLLLPWMGPSAFSEWSEWAKFAHNYVSFAFIVGVVLMFLIWVARNVPNYNDFVWYKNGGGMFGGKEPPAEKFNGGEKMIFWISMIGGSAVIATGFLLLFPFYGTTVAGMELAQVVHSTVALLYVAAMFVHIYMGTIGVEGAFEAMADGHVDVNWAKERHSLWYEEEMQSGAAPQSQAMRPAE